MSSPHSPTARREQPIFKFSAAFLALALGGCATYSEPPFIPQPLAVPARDPSKAPGPSQIENGTASARQPSSTSFFETPPAPGARRTQAGRTPAPPPSGDSGTHASVLLDNLPLPQFINAVFVAILKRNVSIDPQIAQRTDMVSLRTGKPQSDDQLFAAAQAVLRSYGVAVQSFDGLVRFVPEAGQAGALPEIRRGRAQPDVPASLRPVFYLAELEHVQASQVSSWLRTLFQQRLTVQDDAARNAIMLSGQSDTVAAALESIQLLDQPLMRGRTSARIVPVFWSADEMARRLVDVLTAQGYSAALQPAAQTPLIILPIGAVNSIIVFASSREMLDHTLRWAEELDQAPRGRSGNFITYYVRNTDAADLAKTLQEVMGESRAAAPAAASGTAGAPASPSAGANRSSGRVVVNPAANSLIIQTTPSDFQQWYGLLQELDRPARSALVMATVAEVRLTDSEQFGFQWMLRQLTIGGYNVNTGTFGAGQAPTAASGTFRISIANLSGDPRALLTALASNNRIRILSNPSVIARNGEAATIQVGQEVPILTSQVSNANTGTSEGGQGVLQTIQYRSTGVILKVKPVIHAGGRIDLDVSQEVSAAQLNETGVNASPIILNRRLDTKLSVTDGNTLLLGGLMQEQRTTGNAGIPFLKDIPILGHAFRTSTSTATERTELVVLLTTYVVEDDFDARAITDAFRSRFEWAAVTTPETQPPARPTVPAVSDSAPSPGATPAAAPTPVTPPPLSRPYRPAPAPANTPSTPPESVAPAQHPLTSPETLAPGATPASPNNNADIVPPPSSRSNNNFSSPMNGKAVTDEKLLQELRDAFRK